MALTLAQLREHIQTDLADNALTRIMAAEEKRIDVAGYASTARTETKDGGGLSSLFTRRKIGSITSIKERRSPESEQIVLTSNDYRVYNGREIIRLQGGTNGAEFWGREVEVIYSPDQSEDLRNECLIELVRISVEQRALKSEKDGDYEAQYPEPDKARKAALKGLKDALPVA